MDKEAALAKIAEEIMNCGPCKMGKSGMAVPGEGNADSDIVFIGEAPGRQEAKTGRPFIGRSGKLLRALIREIGLLEENVFITSPVKYLPNYGTPTPKDIAHGKLHLEKQISVIDPRYIVLLGNVAMRAILGVAIAVTRHHGEVMQKDAKTYFITFHPAAAIRFPKIKKLLQEDFRKLASIVD